MPMTRTYEKDYSLPAEYGWDQHWGGKYVMTVLLVAALGGCAVVASPVMVFLSAYALTPASQWLARFLVTLHSAEENGTSAFSPSDILWSELAQSTAAMVWFGLTLAVLHTLMVRWRLVPYDAPVASSTSSGVVGTTTDRTDYVVANLLKSIYLLIMCTSPPLFRTAAQLYTSGEPVVSFGTPLSLQLKQYVALYISTDAYALLAVRRLPSTTFVHHVLTTLMGLYVFTADVTAPTSIASMMCWYGICSSYAYAVNGLLALRFRYGGRLWCNTLAMLSLVIYVVACAYNWSYHVTWAVSIGRVLAAKTALAAEPFFDVWVLYTLPRALYLFFVLFLVRDDLILMRWLFRQNWSEGIDGRKDANTAAATTSAATCACDKEKRD